MSEEYIYSTFDAGEVATFDNAVYVRQGFTQRKPNKSWKTTDIINIKGMSFMRDDNNALDGDMHKDWSAIEIAISNLQQNTSKVWKNPTVMNVDVSMIAESIKDILDDSLTFTVAADGIARVIVYGSTEYDTTISIKINGVDVPFFLKGNASMKDANAYKVMAGDVISVPGRYARVFVLPYEYNAE